MPNKNVNVSTDKIAFGGGCYWCIEAVFQSLSGVSIVEQGFIKSYGQDSDFSEAVIVHFNQEVITLDDLITVHLHTHNSTSNHSMRKKYRSAIYVFNELQYKEASRSVLIQQMDFHEPLITKVLNFAEFKASDARYHNYYKQDPDRPFCRNYIHPKLQRIRQRFSQHLK